MSTQFEIETPVTRDSRTIMSFAVLLIGAARVLQFIYFDRHGAISIFLPGELLYIPSKIHIRSIM